MELENCLHGHDACHFDKRPGTFSTENCKLLEFEKKRQGHITEDSHALCPMQTNPQQQRTLSSGSSFWLLKQCFLST